MLVLSGIEVDFFTQVDDLSRAYSTSYNLPIVALSILIAVFSSFCAFEIARQFSSDKHRNKWLLAASLMLAIGIWAMHFIGMLAFRINCGVAYDPWITAFSMVPAIIAAAIALDVVSRHKVSAARLVLSGTIMGAGVGLMHFSGMAGIRLDGILRYESTLFYLSLIAAIGLSIPALGMKFIINRYFVGHNPLMASLLGSIVLAAAISSMHYIAMNSAFFINDGNSHIVNAVSPNALALVIGLVVFLLLLFGIIFIIFGSQLAIMRRRIEAILATTNQGFLIIDDLGLITDCNDSLLEMLGFTRHSVIGHRVHEFINDVDFEMRSSFSIESYIRRSNGTSFAGLVSGRRILDSDGYIRFSFLLISDISDLMVTKEMLRNTTEEQDAILNSASSGIVLLKDRIIYRCNSRLEEMLGYDAGEMLGKSTRIWYKSEQAYLNVGLESYDNIWAGKYHGLEIEFVRKDGVLLWTRLVGHAIDVNAPGKGSVWIIDDISQERKIGEELRSAKEIAEASSKMKSDFLANMSHEIRTPMNAIIGMSYLVLKTDLTSRQTDLIQKIQISSNHLLQIINDILDLSKIEAGKLELEESDFALEEVMDNISNLISGRAADKELELIFDIDINIPVFLKGDSLRLGQILINYANNAVKFTEHGQIVISARLLEESTSDLIVYFSVTDTGIGISEEQKSKLFQSFHQVDTSTSRKYGGTGLGLSISKQLVNMMHGDFGVESESGKGSKFWFTARFDKSTSKINALLPEPDIRGRSVLIVDDNEIAKRVLEDLLVSMTFKTSQVSSGREAFVEIQNADRKGTPFEIVFIDWRMPDLNGIETAKTIKALNLDHPPKLIMTIVFDREDVIEEAEAVGFDGFLIKPINASTLFDTVIRVISGIERKNVVTQQADVELHSELKKIKGASVLLVEDNEFNQEVAVGLLEAAGLEIDIANNGQEALEMITKKPYHIVLMDIQMPVMDGLTATREIRKQGRFKKLPILAMTANAMQQDKVASLAAGMNDHLLKPIDPDELFSALVKWIRPDSNLPLSKDVFPKVEVANIQFEESIPIIEGLDYKQGLKRVLGKPARYLEMLAKYITSQEKLILELESAVLNNDFKAAKRFAHTAKSLNGNIGAIELQEIAAELEKLFRDGLDTQQLKNQLDNFISKHLLMLNTLKQNLPSPMYVSSANPGNADVAEILSKLRVLLANDDSNVTDYMQENHEKLSILLGKELFTQFSKNVTNYDFEIAMKLLDGAKK